MSLLTTIERAIYSRRPRKVLYNPLNEWPLVAGESLDPGAEPETNYQHIDNEIRLVGVVSTAGDNIILPRQNNYDAQVLEVAGQITAAGSVQLKAGGVALSPVWSLSALEKWSAPGIIVSRSFDLVLNLSISTPFAFAVRWKPCYGRL